MKRFATTTLAAATLASAIVVSAVPAFAESIERPWKNTETPAPAKPKGLINSLLPAKPVATKPTAAKTVKTAPSGKKKRKSAVAAAKKSGTQNPTSLPPVAKRRTASKEANWWKSIGNPAVFAFRDCSADYAARQVAAGDKTSAAGLITRAMKTSCQVEFAKMAGVLIGGLGEKRSNAMLSELAKTTFLPKVKSVMAAKRTQKQDRQVAQAAKPDTDEQLETAKAAMFKCFSSKSDLLSAAKTTQANTIADSVLIGCQNKSDAFFDLLFANSKASARVKEQQKNIALNETYRVAIIKRVMATRKNIQVKTAKGTAPQ